MPAPGTMKNIRYEPFWRALRPVYQQHILSPGAHSIDVALHGRTLTSNSYHSEQPQEYLPQLRRMPVSICQPFMVSALAPALLNFQPPARRQPASTSAPQPSSSEKAATSSLQISLFIPEPKQCPAQKICYLLSRFLYALLDMSTSSPRVNHAPDHRSQASQHDARFSPPVKNRYRTCRIVPCALRLPPPEFPLADLGLREITITAVAPASPPNADEDGDSR
ncbi:unnamed protein product [Diplocarpon coronariae]